MGVRAAQFFETHPNHIPGLQKNDLSVYLIEQNVYIYSYTVL